MIESPFRKIGSLNAHYGKFHVDQRLAAAAAAAAAANAANMDKENSRLEVSGFPKNKNCELQILKRIQFFDFMKTAN